MTTGDEVREVRPGDIVYVAPGTPHRIRLLSERIGYLYEIYQPILSTETAEEREPLG